MSSDTPFTNKCLDYRSPTICVDSLFLRGTLIKLVWQKLQDAPERTLVFRIFKAAVMGRPSSSARLYHISTTANDARLDTGHHQTPKHGTSSIHELFIPRLFDWGGAHPTLPNQASRFGHDTALVRVDPREGLNSHLQWTPSSQAPEAI